MLIRALIAFLILPGTMAGIIPALLVRLDAQRSGGSPFGYGLLLIGLFLLLWCVRDFFISGKGTLAPWDPPKHLVIVGLYRSMRNPMYLAILTVVAGWSLVAGSRLVAWYAGAVAIAFHLRVLLHEEPWLKKQFGVEWKAYSTSVPRWFPRFIDKTKSR